jgi:hypothetical protein
MKKQEMKSMKKTSRTLLKCSLLTILLIDSALAGKLDAMLGAYSLNASVNGKSTALSGLGTYELAYLIPFKDHFELNIGYSFTMAGVIGGDYSYGPKLGVNFFPFNFSGSEKILLNNKTIEVQDFFKPYVGLTFNQRQYQSAKASYAGLGISAGFEKYISPKYTIKSEIKMNSYTGAADAKATEINILTGLIFNF